LFFADIFPKEMIHNGMVIGDNTQFGWCYCREVRRRFVRVGRLTGPAAHWNGAEISPDPKACPGTGTSLSSQRRISLLARPAITAI
jgi:hypothetical protein